MIVPDHFTREAIRKMRRYTWQPKFAIFSRWCYLSGERIPAFSKAYRGYRVIHGPGEDVVVHEWALPNAYLMEKLRGTIE